MNVVGSKWTTTHPIVTRNKVLGNYLADRSRSPPQSRTVTRQALVTMCPVCATTMLDRRLPLHFSNCYNRALRCQQQQSRTQRSQAVRHSVTLVKKPEVKPSTRVVRSRSASQRTDCDTSARRSQQRRKAAGYDSDRENARQEAMYNAISGENKIIPMKCRPRRGTPQCEDRRVEDEHLEILLGTSTDEDDEPQLRPSSVAMVPLDDDEMDRQPLMMHFLRRCKETQKILS